MVRRFGTPHPAIAAKIEGAETYQVDLRWSVGFSDLATGQQGIWKGVYRPKECRTSKESIEYAGCRVATDGNELEFLDAVGGTELTPNRVFEYEGSILSAIRDSVLPEPILTCKRYFSNIQSLEMLAPQFMRQRTRESSGSIGNSGQNLASYIHELSSDRKAELIRAIRRAYPQLSNIATRSVKGWKELLVAEEFEPRDSDDILAIFNAGVTTEARHLNDGMLRLIALFAELQSEHPFLLFDEIENGINPELVEYVVDAMVKAEKQIVVTTHSPMILNFLTDDVARKSVLYLYKTVQGETKAIPFFEIPSLAEKLTVMGPGEAFVDTNLTELSTEIAAMGGR